MKTELSFIIFFVGLVGLLLSVFTQLLEKYTYLTVQNAALACSQSLTSFLTMPYHVLGLSIFSILVFLSMYFCSKVLLSTFKTQLKVHQFTRQKLKKMPVFVQRLCTQHSISAHSVIIIRDSKPTAFAMGFFYPQIVLTTGLIDLLTKRELEAVLLHEAYHAKKFHGLLLLAGEIIASTFAFLPIVMDVVRHMKATFEEAADAYATQIQQSEHYVQRALSKVIGYQPMPLFIPAFSSVHASSRLAKLHRHPYHQSVNTARRLVVTLLNVVLLIVLLMLPTQARATQLTLADFPEHCENEKLCAVRCQTILQSFAPVGLSMSIAPPVSNELNQ